MKKNILSIMAIVIVLVAALLGLTGCKTYKTYTYDVDTGDKIAIKLDTSKGYDMTSKLPFKVTDGDDKTVLQGTFCNLDGYKEYVQIAKNNPGSEIIDSGNKNGVEYTFYKYEYPGEETEYIYVAKVEDSDTGVLMGSTVSKEAAKNAFERMKFSKVD